MRNTSLRVTEQQNSCQNILLTEDDFPCKGKRLSGRHKDRCTVRKFKAEIH